MKILQIHKYFNKQKGGGSVTAFFETKKILEKKGHQVIIFSMKDDGNEKSSYEKYFIEHFDINEPKNFWQKIKLAKKSIYNKEAQKKLEELIKKEKPEIAHVHNIYHYLTPAIFHALKKFNIPIVYKLSDYKVICPNYKLFNQGKICEKCKSGKYFHCFLNKCLKNSRGVSFIGMKEAYVHKFLKSYDKINYFLAPSEFMKKKCEEFGISDQRIKILRNVINSENFQEQNFAEKNYFLYYGRLSEEKGIKDLILAIKKSVDDDKLKGNQLYIIGSGPEEKNLKKLVSELKLEKRIIFLGFRKGEELKRIIADSKFTVLPSVWYDNSPLTISESQLLKKPVVISDLGGSKEMIINDQTGRVFRAGDIDDLANEINQMLSMNQESRMAMGEKGRTNIMKLNNEERYYQKLLSIYQELINKKDH